MPLHKLDNIAISNLGHKIHPDMKDGLPFQRAINDKEIMVIVVSFFQTNGKFGYYISLLAKHEYDMVYAFSKYPQISLLITERKDIHSDEWYIINVWEKDQYKVLFIVSDNVRDVEDLKHMPVLKGN